MARVGWALASLVALPLLAGCMSPGNAIPDAEPIVEAGLTVPPTSLVAGTFYAFRHAGGTLGLGVLPGGGAQVDLFNGQDQRLGQFTLSDALADGRLELRDMPAGDYVIRMLAVNGTLILASGGAAPALRPLAAHVERHVLAQADEEALPPVPRLGVPGSSAPVEAGVDLQLLRAPTSLRVLASGDYASLDVELRSTLGPVLAVHTSGSFPVSFSSSGFFDLGGDFHGENVRDGHLTGLVRTTDLRGAVVLEAASFSRAEPLAPPATPAAAPPRFTYGVLPDSPVRFQTGPRATTLLLHGNDFPEGNRTWVALFDDHGHRIGTLAVRSGGTVAVPVAASTGYIAVRLRGNATLGANGAPGDFELHPMQVREVTLPAEGAGRSGNYGQGAAEADGTGVYAIEPVLAEPAQGGVFGVPEAFQSCGDSGLVRVVQGDETLGFWERTYPVGDVPASSDAELRLHDGPLRIVHDGFGTPGCSRPAALLKSFEA